MLPECCLSLYQQKVVCKTVTGTPFAAWTLAKIERYAYDSWDMIMTVAYNGSFTGTPSAGNEVLTVGTVNGRVASYVWGPDIASRPHGHSSWQKAGGVGELLMVVDGNGTWPGIPATTDEHFFPLMDLQRPRHGSPLQRLCALIHLTCTELQTIIQRKMHHMISRL